jgi:rhamnogalacturonan endolyase
MLFSISPLRFVRGLPVVLFALMLVSTPAALAAFGLVTTATYYEVDCGSTPSLVFRIRSTGATDTSTTSPGDISSLKYNGVEYQDQSRGSQINSGFDWIYNDSAAVAVTAETVGTDYIKITVVCGDPAGSKLLTHYYIVHKGEPRIYMATYFTAEPEGQALCRYILRLPSSNLDYPFNVYDHTPRPSDIRNNTGAVESGDVFGMSDGTTRSKHYSGMRLRDWSYIGATNTQAAPTVGCWVVRDNSEGGSGGPFYRSLINQCGTDNEITYIVNYGEGQTEAFRPGILNGYTLVFTNGSAPGAVDTSFFADMGLVGYIAPAGRGTVSGAGITNRDTNFDYTVALSNATAQYSGTADALTGAFTISGVIPGAYTLTIFKNELAVYTTSVNVTAGATTALAAIAISADPAGVIPIFRIGAWDGTPTEFLYGDKVTWMHPSDVRITGNSGTAAWNPGTYVVGASSPGTGIPCYQWKDVNGSQSVQFTLTAAQLVSSTVRIGITTAYAGGRPNISVNSWSNTKLPSPSSQPSSRTLTVGTYRGNNATYSFTVPASALVAGTNTLTFNPISGSSGTTYLSPGYSIDCIEFTQTSATRALPAAPTNLTGSANAATHTVNLTWNAVSSATSYNVFRSTSASGDFTRIASGLTATAYADSDNTDPSTYYYRVTAENTSGAGLPASTAVALTPISVTWTGATSATWDTATANWKLTDAGTATTYADGDTVNFDDSTSATTVSLAATVAPFAVLVPATGNYTFNGAGGLAGTATVSKSGAGTLTVNNVNTGTGDWKIHAGTLALGAIGATSGSLGSGAVQLDDGATFRMAAGGTNFPSNPIALSAGASATLSSASATNGFGGSVSGSSAANLTLAGALSFNKSGVAQLGGLAGSLAIPSGSSLRFSSTSGANGNGGAGTAFVVNGTLNSRNSAGGGGIVLGSLAGSGNVTGQTNSPVGSTTFFIGARGGDTTFSGVISNSTNGTVALTKQGAGSLTLAGANTYTGATTVSAGSLYVTGSLAATAVSVASGATFGGPGSLGGNLSLATGSRLALGVGSGATKGPAVSGTATLTGSITVVPAFVGGALAPGTYTLLTYSGTLGGSPSFAWSDDSGSGYTASFDTATAGVVKITLSETTPTAPAGLTATAGNAEVSLLWNSVTSASSYTVLRSTTSGSGYTTVATGVTGTTFTDAGLANGTTYFYVVKAVNTAGTSTASAEASATPLSDLQAWRQSYFGTTANSGTAADTADPDGDGVSNLLEYATGSDPTLTSSPPDQLSVSGSYLQLTFPRIADPALTYTVSASADLASWTGIWSSTGPSNTAGSVSVFDTVPFSASAHRFLRLDVTAP